MFPPVRINSPVVSFPTPCHPLFMVDFPNNDTLFCSLTLVTFRCKFPADSSTTQRKGARQFFFTRRFNPFSVKCQGHLVKFLGEGIRHALRCPCSVLNFVAVGSFFDAIYYQCFFILFCRQMVHQQ
jgi:hypothetical protein